MHTPVAELSPEMLACWDLPTGAKATLINVSENLTYQVAAGTWRAILRLHRPGYHSVAAILSELEWLNAIRADTALSTPRAIIGRDGMAVQRIAFAAGDERHAVLFEHLPGRHPDAGGDLTPAFEALGEQTARLHDHVQGWTRPDGFERMAWDEAAVFGPAATWGDWRAAPNVTADMRGVLEQVEAIVTSRLLTYGKGADRYGLIHADLRLANVLIDEDRLHLIDFDDCGFGWFGYDFAAAISFVEDDPAVPRLKAAWLTGYRRVRSMPDEDAAMIDTFIMLRRLALLAWIGSHMESTEPQALAPHFALVSTALGKAYLEKTRVEGHIKCA